MPKFFVFSDIHSFFDEFMAALSASGYDRENPDHWLIGCGDYFDRGPKSMEVLEFLLRSPRTLLVRGNHEDLFEEAVKRGWFKGHDVHNGTCLTAEQLGVGYTHKEVKTLESKGYEYPEATAILNRAYDRMKPLLDRMVNFVETKHYIFVHGWIPTEDRLRIEMGEKAPSDWRKAPEYIWKNYARWSNGMDESLYSYEDGKTIVCGHWHCSYGHARDKGLGRAGEFGPDASFEPYIRDSIIAIDACTAHTKKVNILVLEDEFMEVPDNA